MVGDKMGNGMAEDRIYMAELVKRAQKKDSDAFAELYALTYETQYAFSRKYLRDDDCAQDALQEVYILALKNIGNLKEPQYFSTWLRQINFRICYDMSVKRKKQNMSGENELEAIADRSTSSNPEEMLLKRLEREDLERALGTLPVKERNAVILKWMVNMSLDDIAGYMNCSISSVSRYLSKGKKKLRNVLGGGYHTNTL